MGTVGFIDRDQPNVREGREPDVAAVLELWAGARSVAARTPDTRQGLERLLARDDGSLLVAELDGQIVGALIATWDGWRGNLYRLAVLPEHRRRGIARVLVEHGERRLVAMGAKRISALVGRDESVAERLWTAAGYERDELIVRFVKNV